jgi:hypothetical protein
MMDNSDPLWNALHTLSQDDLGEVKPKSKTFEQKKQAPGFKAEEFSI